MHVYVYFEEPIAHEVRSFGVLLRPGVNEVGDGVGRALLSLAEELRQIDGAPRLAVREATIIEVEKWAALEAARVAIEPAAVPAAPLELGEVVYGATEPAEPAEDMGRNRRKAGKE